MIDIIICLVLTQSYSIIYLYISSFLFLLCFYEICLIICSYYDLENEIPMMEVDDQALNNCYVPIYISSYKFGNKCIQDI